MFDPNRTNRYVVDPNMGLFDPTGKQSTTLGDYKQTGFQRDLLLNAAGNGTATWDANKLSLCVAGDQYMVMESNRVHPYFSGKIQLVEITNDRMQHEDGITKRWGYFSSETDPPYAADLDGFWLESDGEDYYLVTSRAGVETSRVPSQQWNNWTDINKYNWQFFSVIFFDFLWLGGAYINLWVKTSQGFILAHTIPYAGTSEDVFILNPSQPLRVEIRGSVGASGGELRYICAQIGTLGTVDEAGQGFSVNTGSPEINFAAVDTVYPLLAVRKKAARVESAVEIQSVDISVGSTNDRANWELRLNPTLSAGLTYADVDDFSIQRAIGDGTITATLNTGTLLASGPIRTGQNIDPDAFKSNFLSRLSQDIDGNMDEYVLLVIPQTGNVQTSGFMDLKEF